MSKPYECKSKSYKPNARRSMEQPQDQDVGLSFLLAVLLVSVPLPLVPETSDLVSVFSYSALKIQAERIGFG